MTHSRRTAHLIANTKSGKGAGEDLPALAKKLAVEAGVELVHYPTDDHAQFEAQIEKAVTAAEENGGTVIAAGGDGTIRSVAQKAAGRNVTLGVVACGTFNFFARGHGFPEDIEGALRIALTGESRPVRLGRINDHYFLINASLGLYAKSIRNRERDTKRWGRDRLVVILSTLLSLLRGHRRLSVELVTAKELKKLRTLSIFIGNNALQLRGLALDVAQCMKQNLLAVVILRPVSKLEMLRIFWRGIAKTLEKENRLESFCAEMLIIGLPERRISVALDGEMFTMDSPLRVEAVPGVLNLALPPREATPV